MAGAQQMVDEFHRACGLPVADEPVTTVQGELAELRLRLLDEEVEELRQAVNDGDPVGVAQELADIVYVAYGHALTNGIDLDAVIGEVHRANMSKLGADGKPLVLDGKVLKGPDYRPPDVAGVLRRRAGARP